MTKETQLTREWIDTLFNSGEYTCMGHKRENKTWPVSKIAETHEYVSINPMKKGTTRAGRNVTRFSNFLFEMDTFNKKEQAALITRSGMPYSTVVDSGNKSLHFILALQEDLGERALYTAYFQAINTVLRKFGADIDEGCKDPGRFTRAPYGVNTKQELVERKPNFNDRVQKVGLIKSRHSVAIVDQWLADHGVNALDHLVTPTLKKHDGKSSNAETKLKVEWIEKHFMSRDQYTDGNKHNYQVKMAYFLLRTGLSPQEVDTVLIEKFSEISTGIGSTTSLTPDGAPIYVPTMEERKAYYKQLDDAERLASNREIYTRAGIDPKAIGARPEDIERYETVGTEYFKIDSVTDNLIPWSKTMFEKLYGSHAMPPRGYDKFGYRPDYTSVVFPTNLGIDGKTRNMFTRPGYKIEPGAWDTIRGGLEHGFGDQMEQILQYCAITIAHPEAKLPALWFIGAEDKGKSAVVAIIKYLVGLNNVKKTSVKGLESDFTEFLGASQLVVVEEAGNWKQPKEVMSNLKDWITEKDTQWINPKYGKKFESPIHCKFIFTSNDWDSLPATGAATRFWVVEVNHDPKNKVTNYYEKIAAEMGHFAHYLINTIVPSLKTEQDARGNEVLDTTNRLYFHPSEYETSAKEFIKSLNKGPIWDGILNTLGEFFEKFPEEANCHFNIKSLKEACNWKWKGDPTNTEIKSALKELFNKVASARLTRPDSLNFQTGGIGESRPESHNFWFIFSREEVAELGMFSPK